MLAFSGPHRAAFFFICITKSNMVSIKRRKETPLSVVTSKVISIASGSSPAPANDSDCSGS